MYEYIQLIEKENKNLHLKVKEAHAELRTSKVCISILPTDMSNTYPSPLQRLTFAISNRSLNLHSVGISTMVILTAKETRYINSFPIRNGSEL
jgi:hypothetical protein